MLHYVSITDLIREGWQPEGKMELEALRLECLKIAAARAPEYDDCSKIIELAKELCRFVLEDATSPTPAQMFLSPETAREFADHMHKAALAMAEKITAAAAPAPPQVRFDRLRVSAEEKGVRLCLEGIVPPELWPEPVPEAQRESHRRDLLARLGVLFSEFLRSPVIRDIVQWQSAPPDHPKPNQVQVEQQKSEVETLP